MHFFAVCKECLYLASYQSVAVIDNIYKACKLSCLLSFKMETTSWLICYTASEQVCVWAESETNWKERSRQVLTHSMVPVKISLFLHVVRLFKCLTGLKIGSCDLTFSAYFYSTNEEIRFLFETEPIQKCIVFPCRSITNFLHHVHLLCMSFIFLLCASLSLKQV